MTGAELAAEVRQTPFAHTTHPSPLRESLCETALSWMETAAPWRLRIASFYEQWELHVDPDALPDELRPLLAEGTVDRLTSVMFQPLGARGLRLTEVTAHKLLPGQTIRVHNDYVPRGETHRLLLQLNRGWSDEQGGLLMLFGSASPEDLRRVLRPTHRSVMAFGINPQSFHAVSTVRTGERYTLVFSFRVAGG